jgi:hypothetical protein
MAHESYSLSFYSALYITKFIKNEYDKIKIIETSVFSKNNYHKNRRRIKMFINLISIIILNMEQRESIAGKYIKMQF